MSVLLRLTSVSSDSQVSYYTYSSPANALGEGGGRERLMLFSSVGSTAFKTFQPIIFQKALNVVYVLSGTRTGLGMMCVCLLSNVQ